MQLSWYKRQFEAMNPDLNVSSCAVLWVRDDSKRGNLSGYYPITPWADEALDLLIDSDLRDLPFNLQQTYGNLPAQFAEVEDEVARLEIAVKAAQERQKSLKEGLYKLMEENNVKQFTGSKVRLTRVLPTKSKSFDAKKFEEEHPDLYKQYMVEKERAGSLKVTLVK